MSEFHPPLERRLAAEHRTLAEPLRALVRRAPVACGPRCPVAEAAARMRAEGVGSVVVVDERGRPMGILTEHDLVAVVADGAAARPIADVMTRDPLALPGHAPAYEAAIAMVEHRIRHVLVHEDETLVGVVSERDLFALQRLGLGELTMEIRLARDVPAIAELAERVRRLTRLLIGDGVAAEPLTAFVTVLNDRIGQRIIEVVRKRHRWERIDWCWLAFGSEGRLEQTFATDQDNGLVFEAQDGAAPAAVRARLVPFAREVNEALDACGYPLCRGNVMASNPELCLSTDEWRAKLRGWLENSAPQALLDAAICFDFRAVAGDARLATDLREWFLGVTRLRRNFLRLMAVTALQVKPPLGRVRDFATEAAPNAPHTLNIKTHGVRVFVDAARLLALAHGLPETNTARRLRAAAAAGAVPTEEATAAVAAFYFLQQIRLRHQAGLASFEGDAGNRVDPAQLNEFDRRVLREAFRIARDLQSRLALDYQL